MKKNGRQQWKILSITMFHYGQQQCQILLTLMKNLVCNNEKALKNLDFDFHPIKNQLNCCNKRV